jgi:hypothetical protein
LRALLLPQGGRRRAGWMRRSGTPNVAGRRRLRCGEAVEARRRSRDCGGERLERRTYLTSTSSPDPADRCGGGEPAARSSDPSSSSPTAYGLHDGGDPILTPGSLLVAEVWRPWPQFTSAGHGGVLPTGKNQSRAATPLYRRRAATPLYCHRAAMAPAPSSSSLSSSLAEVQGTGEAACPHGSPAEEEQGRGRAPRQSLGGRPCSAHGAGEIVGGGEGAEESRRWECSGKCDCSVGDGSMRVKAKTTVHARQSLVCLP